MRSVLIIALFAVSVIAEKHHREFTEEEKAAWQAKKAEKLAKLSPEAQAADQQIHTIFQAQKGDRTAARAEVKKYIESLPASVQDELKTLRGGHHRGGKGSHHRGARFARRELTEEQKEAFKAQLKEKFDKLSPEAKSAANQIKEVRKANKGDHAASKKAIDAILEGLSDSVKAELEAFRPKHHHGKKPSSD